MNVGELKKALGAFPDDMEVVVMQYSDYAILKEDGLSLEEGVDKGGWVMSSHPTMSGDNRAGAKTYLLLAS